MVNHSIPHHQLNKQMVVKQYTDPKNFQLSLNALVESNPVMRAQWSVTSSQHDCKWGI